MSKLHYVVRRSRSGRFNFTLLSSQGRVTGSVMIQVAGKTKEEIEQAAHEKIHNLIGDLATASGFGGGADSSYPGEIDAAHSNGAEAIRVDAASASA